MASSTRTHRRIAGIVLAGGRSSRMGANKALLQYRGRPLIEHMKDILHRSGCADVHISGSVPGYEGIADLAPHEGPARAIADMLRRFKGQYDALVIVPVDMPLITPAILNKLLAVEGNACYSAHPLPAVIATDSVPPVCQAVFELLEGVHTMAVDLPKEMETAFANINTKEEWEALVS